MVEIFKALGDHNRLRIINMLLYGSICVCELEFILEMTQSNVSRHLSKLKNINMIASQKDAQWVYYKLNDTFIKSNTELMNYLNSKFRSNSIYENDCSKYKSYKESGMNCQSIKDNKNFVIELV